MRPVLPRFLRVSLLALCLGGLALAAKPEADDVDPVALATRLVHDGHWDRAAAVLAEVTEPEEDDAVAFYTLKGLVALQLGQHAEALDALSRAVATGEAEPLVHVYLAQAHDGLGQHEQTLTELDRAGDAAAGLAGAWQLRARANRALQRPDAAFAALSAGRERFPEHAGLVQDQLLLLVELGLTREALQLGTELLPRLQAEAVTWVALGDALRRAGALADAAAWLEETRLRFPDSVEARVALAQTCLQDDRPLCAGEMLQEAGAFDPRFASEAAEAYRRAGDLDRALYSNGLVPDETVKVRQRLGLLLEQQRFDQATALDPRLRRLGLLEDEEQVAYALAYAHYRNGSFDHAESLLRSLRDPALFRQATSLREAMDRCRETGVGCD